MAEESAAGEIARQTVGEPNNSVVACAVCGEPKGQVRVQDSEGREVRLCLRCNRQMDWH